MVVRNIIDFTKSLSYDNLEESIRCFDNNLTLYRLIGSIPGIVVSVESSNNTRYRISSTDATMDMNYLARFLANIDSDIKFFVTLEGNTILIEFV